MTCIFSGGSEAVVVAVPGEAFPAIEKSCDDSGYGLVQYEAAVGGKCGFYAVAALVFGAVEGVVGEGEQREAGGF